MEKSLTPKNGAKKKENLPILGHDISDTPSALSTNLLKEHNKSFQNVSHSASEDKQLNVSTWLEKQSGSATTSLSTPATGNLLPGLSPPAITIFSPTTTGKCNQIHGNIPKETPSFPTVTIEPAEQASVPKIVIAGQDIQQSQGSLARLAVVQSMMAVDSDGNILPPVMMSRSGRYQALNNNNAAFQHINLQDLVNIAEQESLLKDSHASITSNKMLQITHQLRRASAVTKAVSRSCYRADKKPEEQDQLNNSDSESEEEIETSGKQSDITQTTIATEPPTVRAKESVLSDATSAAPSVKASNITKKSGGFGTVLMANKWKTKMKKTDPKNNAFAKQLDWHTNKIIEELPMPLKMEVMKEAYPIALQTVKAYERSLGKGHYMTKESNEQLETLTTFYEEILRI